MASLEPRALLLDVAVCVGFFTRFPVPSTGRETRFADALWAAPVAGALVGGLVGLALIVSASLGVQPTFAAALALGVGVAATGALHEDGLADVADGFGGGHDREDKLAIMRDSRIGTYGVLALLFSFALRWAALAGLAMLAWPWVLAACVAAHGASRSLLPAFIAFVPAARADGLGAGVGVVSRAVAATALALGTLALSCLGLGSLLMSVLLLGLLFCAFARLCRSQIGGQTGDVLGAVQQAAEAAVLAVASSVWAASA